MELDHILRLCDHTLLRPEASSQEIKALCAARLGKSCDDVLDEISRIIKLKSEDESGNKRRTELLSQYRSKLSADIERLNTLQDHINELQWHISQLESAEDAFTACPAPACASCEHKTRCIFFRETEKIS